MAEDGDQVFGGQIARPRSLDVDGVQVGMLAAADAVAAGAFHVDGQSAPLGDRGVGCHARGAGWVDARVVHVVPDVEAAVAVEVVAVGPGEAGPIGALRAGQLSLVQPFVVEGVFDRVGAVVHAAFHVGDQDVVAPDVALGPPAREVHPGHVVGVEGGHRPAGKPAVGMLEDRGRARILRVRQDAEHVPLVGARVGVAVRGEGGRVLAGREGGVVGRRLGPGGVRGDGWHDDAGQENADGALAEEAQTRLHGYLPSRERCKGALLDSLPARFHMVGSAQAGDPTLPWDEETPRRERVRIMMGSGAGSTGDRVRRPGAFAAPRIF